MLAKTYIMLLASSPAIDIAATLVKLVCAALRFCCRRYGRDGVGRRMSVPDLNDVARPTVLGI